MSKGLKFLAFTLCVLTLCISLAACSDSQNTNETETDAQTEITYENIDVDRYVKSIQYKGLTVAFDSMSETKADAVWNAVYATAVLEGYPEEKVSYYFGQMKDSYMHYAGGDEEKYLLVLEAQGTSEEEMLADAERLVKEDLVYEYIIKHEGIALTDGEKTALFDKYVAKYSEELGKTPEEVAASMEDYIYESMLYDKTTEYLFTVNTFSTKGN